MPSSSASVRKVIDAAGGPVALARTWNITHTAVQTFARKGYFPLPRAQDAIARWPEAGVQLRDLVRPDIASAMDMQQSGALLD